MLPPSLLRPVPLVVWLALACGCASAPRTNLALEPVPARGLASLAPRYQAQFAALNDALEAHEDQVARRIAQQIRVRVTLEAGAGSESTAAAREILDGMERILDGRALVGSLRLELAVRAAAEPFVEVVLRASTVRRTHIRFRPGPAVLRIHRVTLSPADGGKEGRAVRTQGVRDLDLELDADGWTEVSLGTFPAVLPGNVLAARTRWSLEFLSGEILEEGRSYPAMDVPPAVAERVDLAPILPTAPVEPSELARYAELPDGAWLPLLERTVRIRPERREEALDLLTPVVRRQSDEQLRRLVATLRWLAPTGQPGRDPARWRAWLEDRARSRADVGPGVDSAIDFGVPDRR